jgi:hypothetical protein
VPQGATVALEKLGNSIQVNDRQASRAEGLRLVDLILTWDGRCNYISPEGEACSQARLKADRDQSRHWIVCHAMKEAELIETGELEMANANIVNTEARMNIAAQYKIKCPFSFCKGIGPKGWVVREDSLKRHVLRCAKRHNIPLSDDAAKALVDASMDLDSVPRRGYLGAFLRIHQAS